MNSLYVIAVLIFTVFILSFFLSKYKLRFKNLENQLEVNFKENLQLATAEQLLKELRARSNMPFIILFPIKEKDYNGITIESHGINPVSCLALLHLAKAMTIQNFKKNGQEVPRLPPLDNHFE